jgi:hypothetical protein
VAPGGDALSGRAGKACDGSRIGWYGGGGGGGAGRIRINSIAPPTLGDGGASPPASQGPILVK